MTAAQRQYQPHRKHPALFGEKFEQSWLHPDMIKLSKVFIEAGETPTTETKDDVPNAADVIPSAVSADMLRPESKGVYSFPCLSAKFIDMFKEELEHFYDIAKKESIEVRRPNSMNNYGVVVNEIGMRPMITDLQQTYLWPIARRLFPLQGSQFDDHHSFIVRYSAEEDLGLDMHVDDSDVTFNVCLGNNFTGATLTFCGQFGASDHRHWSHTYSHEVGRAVIHLGTRRHGADEIETGTRANLIVWNHNFEWRASPEYLQRRLDTQYEQEDGPPDAVCLSYTHDRDYRHFKDLPDYVKRRGQHFRGWCPPPGKEYEGYGGYHHSIKGHLHAKKVEKGGDGREDPAHQDL